MQVTPAEALGSPARVAEHTNLFEWEMWVCLPALPWQQKVTAFSTAFEVWLSPPPKLLPRDFVKILTGFQSPTWNHLLLLWMVALVTDNYSAKLNILTLQHHPAARQKFWIFSFTWIWNLASPPSYTSPRTIAAQSTHAARRCFILLFSRLRGFHTHLLTGVTLKGFELTFSSRQHNFK